MLNFFRDFQKKKEIKKALLEFYREVEKNLENCYVMEQRGVLDRFCLDRWETMKNYADISLDEKVLDYARAFEDYNQVMDDFKEFQQWYAASLDNKTKDNAKKLNAKQDEVSERFKGMERVVKSALEILRQQLIEMKILKN